MSGLDIRQKVINGLSKAQSAVSEGSNLVELRRVTVTSDPINGDSESIVWVELVDAIFKSYDKSLINGETILSGDRELVSNGSIEIKQNDLIRAYGYTYIVKDVDKVSPGDTVLVYKSQVRLQ